MEKNTDGRNTRPTAMQQVLNGAQAHTACAIVICRYLFIAWINLIQELPERIRLRRYSDRARARPSTDTGKPGYPVYRGTRVPVLPLPAIVVNQRLARYRSCVLSRPDGLVLTARAAQLHHPRLIRGVAADQHVLNMAK